MDISHQNSFLFGRTSYEAWETTHASVAAFCNPLSNYPHQIIEP